MTIFMSKEFCVKCVINRSHCIIDYIHMKERVNWLGCVNVGLVGEDGKGALWVTKSVIELSAECRKEKETLFLTFLSTQILDHPKVNECMNGQHNGRCDGIK